MSCHRITPVHSLLLCAARPIARWLHVRAFRIAQLVLLAVCVVPHGLPAAAGQDSDAAQAAQAVKKLVIPDRVSRVPDDNDYDDVDSDYCFERMVEGDNVAIFWHKEYGDDPRTNPDQRKRFDVQAMLSECERFYDFYVQELEVVRQGESISDNHKLLIYVFGGNGGTAFGGGIGDTVAALWTPAVRVNRAPYGVLAHEMGHSFQFMSRIDSGTGARGTIGEMSAQYLLWQVYPGWMTFENYHLNDFMKKTHYAFLHPTNMYHSPYVLEYWSQLHGNKFYGNLNRTTLAGEDVVTTYKRMHNLDQAGFNDEMFEACRRFVTWDLKRIEPVARRYANQHHTKLVAIEDGWHEIAAELRPQNYGYNAIRLDVPDEPSAVQLNFLGLMEESGMTDQQLEKAGWRYGFLAYQEDGNRVYGDVHHDNKGTAKFDVPAETQYLWLVVMGAPTEHTALPSGRRRRRESSPEDHWPYQIKIEGTSIHNTFIE